MHYYFFVFLPCRYEGVSKNGKFDGPGVMSFADGSRYAHVPHRSSPRCYVCQSIEGLLQYRYEGEWEENKMQGFGAYVWKDGSIYRGEWEDNAMHGCGVWMKATADGVQAKEGQYVRNSYLGEGLTCPVDMSELAASEADNAASKASKFQLEPAWMSK